MQDSFSNRVDLIYNNVKNFIFSRVFSRSDAEDILHETMLILTSKKNEIDFSKNFDALCFTIARYQILKFITNKKRNKEDCYSSDCYDNPLESKNFTAENHCPNSILCSKELQSDQSLAISKVRATYMTDREKQFFDYKSKGFSKECITNLMSLSKPNHYNTWNRRVIQRLKKHACEFLKY